MKGEKSMQPLTKELTAKIDAAVLHEFHPTRRGRICAAFSMQSLSRPSC